MSQSILGEIHTNRSHYLDILKEAGFVPRGYFETNFNDFDLNANKGSVATLRALIAGCFYPQIAKIEFPATRYTSSVSGAVSQDPEAKTIKYYTKDTGRVFVHPGSTLWDAKSFIGDSAYITFFSRVATSKVFVRGLTPFNAFALLLFCGPIDIDTAHRGLVVDNWFCLQGWTRIGVLVSRLRTVLDALLQQKFEDPSSLPAGQHEVVQAVVKLCELNGLDM